MRLSARASLLLLLAVGLALPVGATGAETDDTPASALRLELVDEVAGFDIALFLTHAGDGSDRRFVVEKGGRIKAIDRDGRVSESVYLDISDRVNDERLEMGLLGLAFHPDFASNGRFFVDYTSRPDGATVVSEFREVDGAVDPRGERLVLVVPQPRGSHNGGMLAFDEDGRLLVGLGDGSHASIDRGPVHDPTSVFGKVIAIDVEAPEPYLVDADGRPFDGEPRHEVVATGLRNPWRFSIDAELGHIYIGDVGRHAWEEIDVVPAGAVAPDFGWPSLEGPVCGPTAPCDPGVSTPPAITYPHTIAQGSVIGGYAYHGANEPLLDGLYLFGDNSRGLIWTVPVTALLVGSARPRLVARGKSVLSFGTDEAGELYVVGSDSIQRVTAVAEALETTAPRPRDTRLPQTWSAPLTIDRLRIDGSEGDPNAPSAPAIERAIDATIVSDPRGCLVLTPTGSGPAAIVGLPVGSALWTSTTSPQGQWRVLLLSDGAPIPDQTVRLAVDGGPWRLRLPATYAGEPLELRMALPAAGDTTICQLPDDSAEDDA